ncbi:hypothetical protein L9F63_024312 [Diploptera punctata]|uniref:Uncharacterized protein n=1 Tax=Diploptera punctata TaxID=6984 RepID=A0AAD8E878_DIPPU|nr:hypothetical protein L9F63_024312 [Diploptera punctata]
MKSQKPCAPDYLEVDQKLLKGTWFLRASNPNIFNTYKNFKENLDERSIVGIKGNISALIRRSDKFRASTSTAMWSLEHDNLATVYQYDFKVVIGVCKIISADKEFFICQGGSQGLPDEHTVIRFRKECPDQKIMEKLAQALKKVCLDVNNFSFDKSGCNSK